MTHNRPMVAENMVQEHPGTKNIKDDKESLGDDIYIFISLIAVIISQMYKVVLFTSV